MKVYVITLMKSTVYGSPLDGCLGLWGVCSSYEKAMLKVGQLIDEYDDGHVVSIVHLDSDSCIIYTDCSEWRVEGCKVE